MDENLSGTTTWGQKWPGINGNEGDRWGLTSLQRLQSAYYKPLWQGKRWTCCAPKIITCKLCLIFHYAILLRQKWILVVSVKRLTLPAYNLIFSVFWLIAIWQNKFRALSLNTSMQKKYPHWHSSKIQELLRRRIWAQRGDE